jgi:hypothetical protein
MLYLRLGERDVGDLAEACAAGIDPPNGVVLDARSVGAMDQLGTQLPGRDVERALDPMFERLSVLSARPREPRRGPWALERAHTPDDLSGESGRNLAEQVAEFAIRHRFTAVLASAHVVGSGNHGWLDVDVDFAAMVRSALDRRNRNDMPLYGQVIGPLKQLGDPEVQRAAAGLVSANVAAIWVTLEGLGHAATAVKIRKGITVLGEFRRLGRPIIARDAGGLVGLGLLASGAADGIAHGILRHERGDLSWYKRSQGGGGQGPTHHIPAIDTRMTREQTLELMSQKGSRARFVPHDTRICPRGANGLLERPRRVAMAQRLRDIETLRGMPPLIRRSEFERRVLRPAQEAIGFAAALPIKDSALAKKLTERRILLARQASAFVAASASSAA